MLTASIAGLWMRSYFQQDEVVRDAFGSLDGGGVSAMWFFRSSRGSFRLTSAFNHYSQPGVKIIFEDDRVLWKHRSVTPTPLFAEDKRFAFAGFGCGWFSA